MPLPFVDDQNGRFQVSTRCRQKLFRTVRRRMCDGRGIVVQMSLYVFSPFGWNRIHERSPRGPRGILRITSYKGGWQYPRIGGLRRLHYAVRCSPITTWNGSILLWNVGTCPIDISLYRTNHYGSPSSHPLPSRSQDYQDQTSQETQSHRIGGRFKSYICIGISPESPSCGWKRWRWFIFRSGYHLYDFVGREVHRATGITHYDPFGTTSFCVSEATRFYDRSMIFFCRALPTKECFQVLQVVSDTSGYFQSKLCSHHILSDVSQVFFFEKIFDAHL